ncbi:hypothetical protein E3Q18_01599 [Wallemia mellicola]|uniref:Uncharacterized protein n=1 Tax=Wallemia mellicola TaxID=1708541 RepID=A0A4T0QAU4_9BASI|nr:hypothetical protein E3Q24_01389 [Wallemia mellicola]TIB92939.1 hypothetical protein E3Q19_01697 [Wallemia mellicola]TIB99373.1 hypothetical protein E3Q18_01599 [Wallemia mellicola]TIC02941.1 hypothetical protein E3Q17_01194 [Wallemia mellicola]TIC06081.1 hypothetical protein E3Q16_01497 [Wallemia mellicola]
MAHLRRPSIDSSVSHESFAARIGGKFRDAITPNISHDDQDDSSDKRGRSFFSRGRDKLVGVLCLYLPPIRHSLLSVVTDKLISISLG